MFPVEVEEISGSVFAFVGLQQPGVCVRGGAPGKERSGFNTRFFLFFFP